MVYSTLDPGLLLRATRLLARSARLAVCHEFEVLLLDNVVASEFLGRQSPILNQRLHALDSDAQPRSHFLSSK
jgi:hypothetical protein